jgi:hypothetical protein
MASIAALSITTSNVSSAIREVVMSMTSIPCSVAQRSAAFHGRYRFRNNIHNIMVAGASYISPRALPHPITKILNGL